MALIWRGDARGVGSHEYDEREKQEDFATKVEPGQAGAHRARVS